MGAQVALAVSAWRRLTASHRVLREIPVQDVAREDFRIACRFFCRNAAGEERRPRLGDELAEGPRHAEVSAAVASLSFSEVKWVTAASISPPRSPSSAASSWCIVKPTR